MDAPPAVPIEFRAQQEPVATAGDRIEIPVVVPSTERCLPPRRDEIVVCAADPAAFRMRPIEQPQPNPTGKAEIELTEGVTAGATAESSSVGGWISNRIMANVKIKF